MWRKRIFALVLFLSACLKFSCAQQHRLDSLQNVVNASKEDTAMAQALIDLSALYMFSDPPKSLEYLTRGFSLSQKLDSKKYIILSYQNYSAYYGAIGNIELSRDYIMKSIPLIEELGNKKYLIDAYFNLSSTEYYLNNYKGAFASADKALQIAIELNDSVKIARCLGVIGLNYRDITADYNMALTYLLQALSINSEFRIAFDLQSNLYSIGSIYMLLNDLDKAKEFTDKALAVSKGNNEFLQMGESLTQLGDIYYLKKDFDKSRENYMEALKITKNKDFFESEIGSNLGLAKINLELGLFNKALAHLNEALQVSQRIGDKMTIGNVYGNFSDAYIKVEKYDIANDYLLKSLAIGKELGRIDLLKDTYAKLANNSHLMRNDNEAYQYQVEFQKLNDSITGEQVLKKTAELQVRYEAEKNEKEIILLTRDKEIGAIEIKKQKVLKNSFIGGLALLSLLSVFVFSNFRARNKLRLQNIRNRIADDLHDDIGSTLNSISVYSEVAKQKSPAVVQELEQIGEASRKIIDAMSDIVWTINTKNDSFEQTVLRLRSFTYNLLRAKNIEHTFRVDESLNSMKLSMEQRRNFYLIFKEALNNLVKYSNASRVAISLTHENGFIQLSIRDNGIGFDSKKTYGGNGLLSMKTRAEEMKAVLSIESELGSGTNIELKWKA